MSNILLLTRQQVIASVEADEDFGPWTISFFEADGVTQIALSGISFTASVGSYPALTSAGGAITVSGNAITFFVPAASKAWATGRYPFMLQASDGTYTRDIFANSTLTVGAPAAFSVSALASAGAASALSSMSGAQLLSLLGALSSSQLQSLAATLADAQAAYVPALDFSHVNDSQYLLLPALSPVLP
ncbi:hypothetical protein [Rhodoblastus sp.]|uniref:hypothetical protein n=1 Tax=Rhodoblastus sp. TaxID=1962975 RepID=UPI002618107F|nr:hypothetical protein [Rhodoblastus sp.]